MSKNYKNKTEYSEKRQIFHMPRLFSLPRGETIEKTRQCKDDNIPPINLPDFKLTMKEQNEFKNEIKVF